MVGVAVLVIPSLLDVPVSLPEPKAGAPGVPGALVSTVTDSPDETLETLPAASVTLAVMVWLPADRVELVIDQLPVPSAVAVPSTVVPSVSYSVTVLLASAVPVKVGVVALVMLSVLDVPVSLAVARSGVLEAPGAVVSMTMFLLAPSEFVAPGVARVSSAARLVELSRIVPPFSDSAEVER